MEVILQEEMTHLGHIGEVVKVRDGYARNYLFPRGLAVLADKRQVGELEHKKRMIEEKRLRVAASTQEIADKMALVDLSFTARAGDGGKLFGSITNQDIEKELLEKGFEVDRRRIKLEEPIKSVGEHKVTVALAAGVPCVITVKVIGLEEPKEEKEPEVEAAASDDEAPTEEASEPSADTESTEPEA